jgi:hypothetical protein
VAIDFHQIHSDLFDLIAAGPEGGWSQTGVDVFFEAEDRLQTIASMPYIDVRLDEAEIEERSIPTGEYAFIGFEIDIVTYDLNSAKEAAKIRSELINDIYTLLKNNRQFSAQLNTSRIVPNVKFSQGTVEGATIAGGIMSATIAMIAEVYVE